MKLLTNKYMKDFRDKIAHWHWCWLSHHLWGCIDLWCNGFNKVECEEHSNELERELLMKDILKGENK